MAHELIPLADGDGWTRAVAEVRHALGHTWGFCEAVARTSGLPTHLFVHRSVHGVAVVPVAERSTDGATDAVTPYGFSGFACAGSPDGLAAAWRAVAEERRWVAAYVALHPALPVPAALAGSADLFEHQPLFLLDLTLDDAALFGNLSANRRRALRTWAPEEVRDGGSDQEELAAFLVREHAGFFARKGGGDATALRPSTLDRLAALPQTFLAGAPARGPLEAVAMFGVEDGIGEYLFNVSTPGGERHGVPLVWAGVQRLRALGARTLHLGGGVRSGDDIAEFKRRFGATPAPLRSLRQVFRPERYDALCRAVGADAADRRSFFPAYRAGRPARSS